MHNQSTNLKRGHGAAATALLASIAVAGGSFVAVAASGGPAFANPMETTSTTVAPVAVTTVPANATLTQLKATSATQITARTVALGSAVKGVQRDSYLGANQASLVNSMEATTSGLTALGVKIAADTTTLQAQADNAQIFAEYRTYFFVLPNTGLVVAVDHQTNVAIPGVQTKVTSLNSEITSTTPKYVVRWVTNAQTEVTKATAADAGVSTQLLSYTAADWNSNHGLFASANGAIKSAQWDIYLARTADNKASYWFAHNQS